MKLYTIIILYSSLAMGSLYAKDTEILKKKSDDATIIDSAILRTADGHFITYDDIGIMLQLREHLRIMLYGSKNHDGVITGPYTFDNKAYCLRTLTLSEKNINQETKESWLTDVRNAFKERTKETKKRAEGTKTQQYLYIEASCTLHNRPDSILLRWAKAPEGKEDDAIDVYVTSFYEMSTFVIDLMNFLDDMISSCPKAKKQFLDRIPDEQEREKVHRLLNHIFEQQKNKIKKIHDTPVTTH